jgi:hypothetical protein
VDAGPHVQAPEANIDVVSHPRTRLQNNIRNPKTYTDGTIHYACLTSTGGPTCLDEALQHEQWRKVMVRSIKCL